tara:strand:- start:6603 stop:7169 length:567 start_codon:yes stop_codon:yes gene_type:complete
MKYLTIVGIGLVIWGVVTLDWFKAGFGALLFVIAFLIDLTKKKRVMSNDRSFSSYKTVSELIRFVRESIESYDIDPDNPKAKLAQGLFFLGIVDAASQASNLNDEQFLDLFNAVFTDLDYDFDEEFKEKIILFHQCLDTQHGAFPALMKGGDLFVKFINGNTMAPIAGGMLIEELVEDPKFPTSVAAL